MGASMSPELCCAAERARPNRRAIGGYEVGGDDDLAPEQGWSPAPHKPRRRRCSLEPYVPELADDDVASAVHIGRPGGGGWDWPLSRIDQKVRLLMIDRKMMLLEREEFLEQVERVLARAEAAPVHRSAPRARWPCCCWGGRKENVSLVLGGQQQASPAMGPAQAQQRGKGAARRPRAAVGCGGG